MFFAASQHPQHQTEPSAPLFFSKHFTFVQDMSVHLKGHKHSKSPVQHAMDA
jgi:hypothetical protein